MSIVGWVAGPRGKSGGGMEIRWWWRDGNQVVVEGWTQGAPVPQSREHATNQKLHLGRSHKFEGLLETPIQRFPESLNKT